ncbi:hypothetical protein HYALB_00000415 [Hymenoscyphus albidus]|uniref:Uncharacterized protein n=1 Tax=Hymenoscyphus albidus TaxID=595503 RepID=A0A9N9LKX0_9HELO|nr:hypothetical protein HYALB_00000415 [Hymenoscyphus albidus]
MPPYKDDQLWTIVPGSYTTQVQVKLPESLAPAEHNIPTRMFLAPDGKTYEPYRVKENDAGELIEYPDDGEGAIRPLKGGKIVNMNAFLAFLEHIHSKFQPSLTSALIIVAQPEWKAPELEELTRFAFVTLKVPAFMLIDSALAAAWGYGLTHGVVIDVGYEKINISTITDSMVNTREALPLWGGERMTEILHSLLKGKHQPEFTMEMAEELKKSPLCEVLTPVTPLPSAKDPGQTVSGPSVEPVEVEPVEDDLALAEKEEGVLDVASIVASGKTAEFLAKKKEKENAAAARKATKAAEALAAKPVKPLPNSKQFWATWSFNAPKSEEEMNKEKAVEAAAATQEPAPVTDGEQSAVAEPATTQQKSNLKKDSKKKQWEEANPGLSRHDFKIGVERFQIVDPWFLHLIADSVFCAIQNVEPASLRQPVWDNMIICGGGAKIKGFKDALHRTLLNKYLISPSSATMFMSELPSNIATPSGTGSMTPSSSFAPTHPTVNPSNSLLIAATTASNSALNPGLSQNGSNPANTHSSHSQTPTAIKFATPPTYFPEWKEYYDVDFLGSCIAAKTIFGAPVDQVKGYYVTRSDFNRDGPKSIHDIGLV